MKLPSNDKNTRQEHGSLPIRAKVCQFTKAPIRYVNDTVVNPPWRFLGVISAIYIQVPSGEALKPQGGEKKR